jgi:tRNA pseudouridine55 synthase
MTKLERTPNPHSMDGFLNLNKPLTFTSHDCIAKLRRQLNTKKIGHAGTLDPAASGVLPIAIGRATRLLQYLTSDKAYKAKIRFGLTTDTDDLQGTVLTTTPATHLTLEDIQPHLAAFQGTITQIPPSYSAIQVDGKRLYDLARSGQSVTAPSRTVTVYAVEVLNWTAGDYPELDLHISCGSGTYIRSIARDLGALLQTGATLSALERTASSGFSLADSYLLDQVTIETPLIHPEQVLQHHPKVTLTDAIAQRYCWGQKIALTDLPPLTEPLYRIHRESGEFLGMASLDDEILRAQMVYEPESRF